MNRFDLLDACRQQPSKGTPAQAAAAAGGGRRHKGVGGLLHLRDIR